MKSLKQYIPLIIVLFCPMGMLFSQSPSDFQIRRANHHILEKLRTYEDLCDFSQTSDFENFVDLFSDSAVTIMNDILPCNRLNQKVPIEAYIQQIYESHDDGIEVEVEALEIGAFKTRGSKIGEISVLTEKRISSLSKQGVVYTDTFLVNFTFKVDFGGLIPIVQIANIEPVKDYGRYVFLTAVLNSGGKPKPMANAKVTLSFAEGSELQITLDSIGAYFMKRIPQGSVITVRAEDPNVLNEEVVNLNSSKIQVGGETAPSNESAYNLTFRVPKYLLQVDNGYCFRTFNYHQDGADLVTSNNFSFSSGLRFGKILKQSPRGYWNLSTGIEWTRYSTLVTLSNYAIAYPAIDPFDVPYVRKIQIDNIHEENTLAYLGIPLTIEKGINVGQILGLYISSGVDFKYLLKENYKSTANALYSGYYEQYFGITIADSGVYDFGQFNLQSTGKMSANKFLVCANIGLGLEKTLHHRFVVFAGCYYSHNLTNVFEKKSVILSNEKTELRSMTDLGNRIELQVLQLKFGFKVKI